MQSKLNIITPLVKAMECEMKNLPLYFIFIIFFSLIFSRYAYSFDNNSYRCLMKLSAYPQVNKLVKLIKSNKFKTNGGYRNYIEKYAEGMYNDPSVHNFMIAGKIFACNGNYPNTIESYINSYNLYTSNNHNHGFSVLKFDKYIGITKTSINWIFLIPFLLLLLIPFIFLRTNRRVRNVIFIIAAVSILLKFFVIFFLQFHENIFKHLNDIFTYEGYSQYIYKNLFSGKSLLFSFYNFNWPAPAYSFYNGLIYVLFGNNIITVEIINSVFIGTLSSLLAFLLAKKIFSEKVGIISFVLFSISPDLLFFNSLDLKISLNIFIVLLIFNILFYWNNKFKYLKFLLILFLLYYDGLIRVYSGIFLAISIILWLIFERRKYNFKFYEIIPAIFLIIFISTQVLNYDLLNSINKFKNAHQINNYVVAAFMYVSHAFIGGRYRIIAAKPIIAANMMGKGLIIKTIYYIFSPFLWLLPLKYSIMLFPSVILWYILLPFFLYGCIKWFKIDIKSSSIFLFYIFMVSSTIIFFTGNMMQMYVYRLQLLPFFYIIASYGIIKIKKLDNFLGISLG